LDGAGYPLKQRPKIEKAANPNDSRSVVAEAGVSPSVNRFLPKED
jgi:hypothetical protein